MPLLSRKLPSINMCSTGSRRWKDRLAIRSRYIREFLAEILGTFVLVTFAVGAGCQLTLGGSSSSSPLTAHLTGSMGVMLGITVAGGVSGGGVNPAVSLAFCLTGRTPWRLYPVHVLGQMIGSFSATALVYAVYKEALDAFDGGDRQVIGNKSTAAMFTSFPEEHLSPEGGYLDQVVGTGMLIICIHAILDGRNMDSHKGIKPLLVGFCVLAIGGALGLNCGYPINPSRDLGPRLFLLAAEWGPEVFEFNDYNWFWVPILGPLTGSLAGSLIYYAFIGWHWGSNTYDMDTAGPNNSCTSLEAGNERRKHESSWSGIALSEGSLRNDQPDFKGVINHAYTPTYGPNGMTNF